jgi:hypothetical protein
LINATYLNEAKCGQDLTPEQKKLFDSSEFKQKIVAKGVGFFLDNSSFSE